MHALTVARRTVLSVLVLAIGLIHLLDLPGKWEETRWMGVGYLGLIATCVLGAGLLLDHRSSRLPLLLAAGVATGPMIGFVLTRTTGLPGAKGDIGNWLEPLGLASLFVEAVTVMLAAAVLLEPAGGPSSGDAQVPTPRSGADSEQVRSYAG